MQHLQQFRDWFGGKLTMIRDYVNGDTQIGEAVDRYNRGRSVSEDFIVQLASEVKAVIKREKFRPPGEDTYIPPAYIVFLSREDDRFWQGQRRSGMEKGLSNAVADYVSQLASEEPLATESVSLELRIDGTLDKGKFRVQAVWDSEAREQTVVKTTTRGADDVAHARQGESARADRDLTVPNTDRDLTVVRADTDATDRDLTVVRPPDSAVLYYIEVRRDGDVLGTHPVTSESITIGRGSTNLKPDLWLTGDVEVSRIHLALTREGAEAYRLKVRGRNSVTVVGRFELRSGEEAIVANNDTIELSSFTLRLLPKGLSESENTPENIASGGDGMQSRDSG